MYLVSNQPVPLLHTILVSLPMGPCLSVISLVERERGEPGHGPRSPDRTDQARSRREDGVGRQRRRPHPSDPGGQGSPRDGSSPEGEERERRGTAHGAGWGGWSGGGTHFLLALTFLSLTSHASTAPPLRRGTVPFYSQQNRHGRFGRSVRFCRALHERDRGGGGVGGESANKVDMLRALRVRLFSSHVATQELHGRDIYTATATTTDDDDDRAMYYKKKSIRAGRFLFFR